MVEKINDPHVVESLMYVDDYIMLNKVCLMHSGKKNVLGWPIEHPRMTSLAVAYYGRQLVGRYSVVQAQAR